MDAKAEMGRRAIVILGACAALAACKSGDASQPPATANDANRARSDGPVTRFAGGVVNTANKVADKTSQAVDATGRFAGNTANQVGGATDKANDATGKFTSRAANDVGNAASQAVDATGKFAGNAASDVSAAANKLTRGSSAASASSGTWACVATFDTTLPDGKSKHQQDTGPWTVTDNGDGTVSIRDATDTNPCPRVKWAVSGATAKVVPSDACTQPGGMVIRAARGDATLGAKALTASGVDTFDGHVDMQVTYSLQCAR
ncbi:MAG TPA: hypothetical protein VHV30_00530 [Polyangiaceae bacterium]|jgi:hypothetical protein|nr:hypothetical protein [Polyangiaceae bacterium]